MRLTTRQILNMKAEGRKIPMLTAYDYATAKILDEANLPMILVGDSLGMVILGYESTIPVTMEDMIHHGKAVVRGCSRAMVVVDLPFMSYQVSCKEALRNAGRLIKETGAQAVKLEGGKSMADTIRKVVDSGIPVMGHLGLTPQSVNQLGGYRVVGKSKDEAEKLIDDAYELEKAGIFSLVLESVPARLAELISQQLTIPTIGIGSGVGCDGQVQVVHDILGLYSDFVPKHTRVFADVGKSISDAVSLYIKSVNEESFPDKSESFSMNKETLADIKKRVSSDAGD